MMRSLYSGVAGLKTHQTKMDVIGNNIANVNTTSFKSQSITFSDLMYQTTQNASGATLTKGGVNARQIGLGAKSGAINTAIESQGATQTTNNPFDLMITGKAFFVVNNGKENMYTRDGSFYIDGAGNLAMQSNGYFVMGWNAVEDPETGEISVNKNGELSNLQIMSADNTTYSPASTTQGLFSGNLDDNDKNINSDEGKTVTLEFYDNKGYLYTGKFNIKDTEDPNDHMFSIQLMDILDSNGTSIGTDRLASVKFGEVETTDNDLLAFNKEKYEVETDQTAEVTTVYLPSGSALFNEAFVPQTGQLKDILSTAYSKKDYAGLLETCYGISDKTLLNPTTTEEKEKFSGIATTSTYSIASDGSITITRNWSDEYLYPNDNFKYTPNVNAKAKYYIPNAANDAVVYTAIPETTEPTSAAGLSKKTLENVFVPKLQAYASEAYNYEFEAGSSNDKITFYDKIALATKKTLTNTTGSQLLAYKDNFTGLDAMGFDETTTDGLKYTFDGKTLYVEYLEQGDAVLSKSGGGDSSITDLNETSFTLDGTTYNYTYNKENITAALTAINGGTAVSEDTEYSISSMTTALNTYSTSADITTEPARQNYYIAKKFLTDLKTDYGTTAEKFKLQNLSGTPTVIVSRERTDADIVKNSFTLPAKATATSSGYSLGVPNYILWNGTAAGDYGYYFDSNEAEIDKFDEDMLSTVFGIDTNKYSDTNIKYTVKVDSQKLTISYSKPSDPISIKSNDYYTDGNATDGYQIKNKNRTSKYKNLDGSDATIPMSGNIKDLLSTAKTRYAGVLKDVYGLSDSDARQYGTDGTYKIDPTDGSIRLSTGSQTVRLTFDPATGKIISANGNTNNQKVSMYFAEDGEFYEGNEAFGFQVKNPNDKDELAREGTIELDFSTVTNYNTNGSATVKAVKGDKQSLNTGRAVGEMNGVTVSTDGQIYATYSNGQTKLLGQIASAEFANASGLMKEGDNLYKSTLNSGEATIQDITTDGGYMSTGVLEMSNVDLSSQFTEMITTQRGFQANSRIITVSDTLLEELTNLKR
ncbi:flagellar hook-basal body complex protein [Butyrivibrio sp. MC2021]|uniref:flagellar hook-basal body complex protein n=1 Tax=Butyrivibrio sp. MC2021 TaxID=1408306 RepID=UPI0006890718|nr:flagellar hook-basal body complex protein [Butyrivibrio sp. MC2021]